MNTPNPEPLVEVELAGAPSRVPKLYVAPAVVRESGLTIPFENSYDHFLFDRHPLRGGRQLPPFVWSGPTGVARL